jgi:LAS superfamily LD-carboxypeptidase LdcB
MKRKQLSGQGNPAATPGTSKHGWGLAVDINTQDQDGKTKFKSDIFQWLTENAGRFKFIHPEWAAKKGSAPEAHHWEYDGDHGLIKK